MMLQNRRQIGIYFLIFTFLLIGCASYTESENAYLNNTISIKVTSGNVFMGFSGHISENDPERQNFPNEKTPIVSQGRITINQGNETINQDIILYETQKFEYTLTDTETLVVNVRSADDNDAQLIVIEYGKEKEYKIDGKNKVGQIISFRN
jgi:hypothetical protein